MPVDRDELEAALRRLDEQIASAEALGITRPSARLALVVEAADRILSVDSVGILLLDESGTLRAVAASGTAASALERLQAEFHVGPGITALGDSGTRVSHDLREDYPELARHVAGDGGGDGDWAVVSAPIRAGGQDVGNLNAVITGPHDWSDGEVRAVEAFADVVATVLQLSAVGLSSGGGAASSFAELGRPDEGGAA